MRDTTIKKVESDTSPRGDMGQRYLVSGESVSMRQTTKRSHPGMTTKQWALLYRGRRNWTSKADYQSRAWRFLARA
jgi:hypothetical protein